LDNKKPDENFVPASEQARLTDRKIDRRRAGHTLPSDNAHQDGQKMKENQHAF
jgi:hypothetical protein